eukprot:10804139-Lingulodinium_polyedra.AAC.1
MIFRSASRGSHITGGLPGFQAVGSQVRHGIVSFPAVFARSSSLSMRRQCGGAKGSIPASCPR